MKPVTWGDVWSHARGWLRDVLLTLAERLDERRTTDSEGK